MANAQVEKLKTLGIRHGEKAAVVLLGALCLFFVVKGVTHPTIELTPDQVKKSASAAEANLRRPQKDEDILAKLEAANIKEAGFEKLVDSRLSVKQDATQFASDNSWVSPEPGAGLLREMPTLIAIRDLNVHPGRGGLLMVQRDQEGNIIREDPETKAAPKAPRRPRRPSMPMGSQGGGSGSSSGGGGRPKGNFAAEQEAKKQRERDENKRKAALAGKDVPEESKEEESTEEALPPPKEITKGYRWVAMTGVIDHQTLKDNYAKALKVDAAAASPHYLRLEAERQQLNSDGTWPEKWEALDREASKAVLNDAYESEEELAPADVLLKPLVDELPFLKVGGFYRGVHVTELVPAEKKTTIPPKGAGGGMGGMGAMSGSSSGGGGDSTLGSGGMGPMSGSGGMSGMGPMSGSGGMSGMGPMSGSGSGSGSSGSMMGGEGGMFGGGRPGASGGPADTDFETTASPKVMVRMLDFTVDPDAVYRYRVRIVVRNPNLGWEMVTAGTDTKTEEMTGPWSETSDPVEVPADVAAYAMGPGNPTPSDSRNKVQFQVVRFDLKEGVTVVKNFEAAPGEIIGEEAPARVPKGDKEAASRRIDFTSHQIVLDAVGGTLSLSSLNIPGAPLEDPARALVMRPDGLLVLRDEARDTIDGQMAEMKSIYEETLDMIKPEKQKKRRGGMGSGMMGSSGMGSGGMGSMGGMR